MARCAFCDNELNSPEDKTVDCLQKKISLDRPLPKIMPSEFDGVRATIRFQGTSFKLPIWAVGVIVVVVSIGLLLSKC
ncbi:MAG: hypothetical protein V1754_10735 [Pseudomonadota bacterium]